MATATELKTRLDEQIEKATPFKAEGDDKTMQEFFHERKDFLKEHRKNKKNVEKIWRAADKAYEPHTIEESQGKKALASDDELGWRSKPIILGSDENWQENSVPTNPYIKIQTALGIIVDRNPTAILKPGASKYEKNNNLIRNLYERNWKISKSKSTLLKPFVFNLAKYGFAVGRTFPLKIARDVDDLVSVSGTEAKYKTIRHVYFDDIFRENLSPWQCWFDDAAVVGNPWSCNDNMWYKDYSWDSLYEQFGHLPNFKYIKPTKKVLKDDSSLSEATGETKEAKYQERLWFYENLSQDRFYIETDSGVILVNEPIPKKARNKRLSLWFTHWTLRNDKDIEGIGVYEAMRNDHKIHTKVLDMTIDQLVQSIYKEFFYEGTDMAEGDGIMRTRPGGGRQMTNPQNIRWNEIPGPGKEAWEGIKYFEERMEESSGITKGLSGEVIGKTAFETSQAREAALKRLKTPLENITDALETEAYITVSIIEDLYSIPRIKAVAEDRYIDPIEKESNPEMETIEELREVPLSLEQDKQGNIVKTDKEQFFKLAPDLLPWEGVIEINGQSILADSELLERTTTLEMANALIPLLSGNPQITMKPAKEIVKAYNKDPQDWLPDQWLNPSPTANLFASIGQPEGGVAMDGSPSVMVADKMNPLTQNGAPKVPSIPGV